MRFITLIKREAEALGVLKTWVNKLGDSVIIIKRIFRAIINKILYLSIRANKLEKIYINLSPKTAYI